MMTHQLLLLLDGIARCKRRRRLVF